MIVIRQNFEGQSGVTLTELLVVTVVIGIVAALALMQFGSSREQLKRQNVAQQLKQAFERARFDSVKRRANAANEQAKVEITATSFSVFTDRDGNGIIETADGVVTSIAGQGLTITGNSMSSTATIIFNKRGEITVSGITNPEFLICNGTCTFGTDNTSNANIVLVTPTGTVNLLGGGSSLPTFATPVVTPVPYSADIKSGVSVP